MAEPSTVPQGSMRFGRGHRGDLQGNSDAEEVRPDRTNPAAHGILARVSGGASQIGQRTVSARGVRSAASVVMAAVSTTSFGVDIQTSRIAIAMRVAYLNWHVSGTSPRSECKNYL